MTRSFSSIPPSSDWTGAAPDQELFQRYSKDEYKERTNVHYEQPAEFFFPILGGTWQIYSCNIWEGQTTDTGSQEAKMDLFAKWMHLQPGQRILDVGCGWGGPLTYLSTAYGVQGTGINLSPTQTSVARDRAAKYQADVQIFECNWEDIEDDRGFDAIYTDEASVHFTNLDAFFVKMHSLLRPGGCLAVKECHFTSSRYHQQLTRANVFNHEIFGLTGSYRTLADELTQLDKSGLEMRVIHQIDLENYRRTSDRWLANMHAHREELIALVGQDYYRRFRTYLKLVRKTWNGTKMTVDIVVSYKV